MKITNIIKLSLPLIVILALTGCSKKEPAPDAIASYYKDKNSLDDFDRADSKSLDSMGKYLAKKKIVIENTLKYKQGDNISEFIKELVHKKSPNSIVIINKKYNNLTFLEDAPAQFANLTEFVTYINLSASLDYVIKVDTQGRYKKVIFTSTDTLEGILEKTDLTLANNMGQLDVLNMVATQLKITLDIDAYSKDKLSMMSPEAVNTNALIFLKNITGANNLFLTITKDTVKIHHQKSKVYDIFITPLTIAAASQSSLDATDGANDLSTSKSTGTQDSELSFGYKIYDELSNNIKNIVGAKGMFFLNQASGQLTVRTEKENLELVDIIVEKFNNMYSKQIEMRMQIIEVRLNEEHKNGIDFFVSGISKNGNFGASFNTARDASGNSNSQMGGATDSAVSTIVKGIGSAAQGTKDWISGVIDINLLNVYGDVTVVSKPVLKTLNSIPAVLDIGLEQEYLSKITTTHDAETNGITYETETAVAKDGLKIYMYPRIVRDNQILLTITPQISTIVNLEDAGTTGIKTKTVNSRTFNSTLVFNNGETIMFAGLMSKYTSGGKTGMPWIDENSSWTDYLAGQKVSKQEKTELILVVTVKIINQ